MNQLPQIPLRVLVADPEQATRQSMQRALEAAGFSVCGATTGAETIWICEDDPPDILIMELHMPDWDGFDVCSQVRRTSPNVDLTVIVTTTVTDDMTRTYLGPMVDFAGGDYFFARPCDCHAVVHLLNELSVVVEDVPMISRAPSPTHAVWPTGRQGPYEIRRKTSSPGLQQGRRPTFLDRGLPTPRASAGFRPQ